MPVLAFHSSVALHRALPASHLHRSCFCPSVPRLVKSSRSYRHAHAPRLSAASPPPPPPPDNTPSTSDNIPTSQSDPPSSRGPFSWLSTLISKRKELRAGALRDYGLAAFLSYGLFDFVTYSLSFLLSLRAYIAAGKVLTWNTLPQVLALMWGINNLSRPFRIAGAIALAPVVDRRIVKPVAAFFAKLRSKDS